MAYKRNVKPQETDASRYGARLALLRGIYHVAFWKGDRRVRLSLRTKDKAEALERLAAWKRPAPSPAATTMIYFVQAQCPHAFIKIGIARDVEYRLRQIQALCPYEVRLLATMRGGVADEAQLHIRFRAQHVRGEWFRPSAELLRLIAENRKWSVPAPCDPLEATAAA